LQKIVETSSKDKTICQANFCYDNVIRLTKQLEKELPGFDLEKSKVLYIISPEIGALGLSTRTGHDPWAFHVVLEHDGKVLDMDFAGKQTVLSLDDYLKKMFLFESKEAEVVMNAIGVTPVDNKKILESLKIRPIPAKDYLKDYGYADLEGDHRPMHDFTYYLSDKVEAKYPSKNVGTVLKTPPKFSEIPKLNEDNIYNKLGESVSVIKRGARPFPKLSWDFEGITHELDLKDGSVMLNNGYNAVQNPEMVQKFLKKIYYQMQTDPALKDAIENAKTLRKN
jgi:hypothetical protein